MKVSWSVKPRVASTLYKDKLFDRYILFNTLTGKIGVLTERVYKIFQLCNGLNSIAEIYKRQNLFTKEKIFEILQKLTENSFLEIPGYEPAISKKFLLTKKYEFGFM